MDSRFKKMENKIEKRIKAFDKKYYKLIKV